MAMTTASGSARRRRRATCGLSRPSEAWRSSALRLRLMAHPSTSFVRRTERRGKCGACRFLAARPDCSSPTYRAPSGGRQTVNASRSCALESVPTLSSQLFVADADGGQERELASQGGSAPWIHWWLRGDRASLRPGHPTAGSLRSLPRAPTGGRIVFVDSGTGAIQDVKSPIGLRDDGRTQLARRPVARAQPCQPSSVPRTS